MKKYLNNKYILFFAMAPFISLAITQTITDLIAIIQGILAAIVPLIFSLAVIYFIWTTAQYILKEGDAKNEARSHMIWGIVILFVMVSIWGLVAILTNTFLL